MDKINLAVIGCGAAARRYYISPLKKNLRFINNLFLVDKNPSRAEEMVKQIGKGQVSDEYQNLIQKLDGAIILVPHFQHYCIALDFLKGGVNVLCEKPLAQSITEVMNLNKAAEENCVSLSVNHTRRIFPSFRAVKQIFDEGTLGQIKAISFIEGNAFDWESSTGFYVDPKASEKGVLVDIGSHVLDLICWWLNGKPTLVSFQDDSFGGPESVVRIKAKMDSCEIEIFLNRLNDIENRFEISAELGSIEGSLYDWNKLKLKLKTGKIIEKKLVANAKTYPDFMIPIVENFIDVIQKKAKPLVSGIDAKNSIKLMEECYENRKLFRLPWYKNCNRFPEYKGKILITGASGFIGGRIVELLHLKGNYRIKAGIRRWASAARLGRFPVDIVMMDLMDKKSIEKALEGVTGIIHCAKGPDGVTVQGTRNLLEVALKKSIESFVHFSTAEVYGDASGTIDEDTPFSYTGIDYNQTKIEAEKACWEYSKKGLPVTVLRPSIVYGPFSNNWSIRFARLMIEGKWGVYDRFGFGKCNLIYIDDLVEAALTVLNNEKAKGQAFNINRHDVITWNEYFNKFNEKLSLMPLKAINPKQAILRATVMEPVRILGRFVRDNFMGSVMKVANISTFAKKMLKTAESAIRNTPSYEDFHLYNRDAIYLSDKAKKVLNFTPSVSLEEGLNITVKWLEHQGIIN
jgi:predicted dehydrogenase/nucleoside-diphosphate-sugar epimerase